MMKKLKLSSVFSSNMMSLTSNERGGAKTDTLIKLVLIFFISLLSFSVGTFVGKQFSDSQHRLASLGGKGHGDHDSADRDTASIPPGHTEVKPEDALTDDDINKLSEEFADNDHGSKVKDLVAKTGHDDHGHDKGHHDSAKDSHAEAKGAKAPVKPAHTKDDHGHSAEAKGHDKAEKHGHSNKADHDSAAHRVAEGKTPVAPVKATESRVPSSLPSAVAGSSVGKFTVQVSSYKTEEEARKAAEALKAKGLSAFYVSADVSGTQWYRVSVGTFASRQEAVQYRSTLLEGGSVASALVQKIAP